jgi:hypothetical protein
MALVVSMPIVVAKNTAMIDPGHVRHDKCKIVANDLVFFVHPDFLAQNAVATSAGKGRFIVYDFARAFLAAHEEQLNSGDASIATPESSLIMKK